MLGVTGKLVFTKSPDSFGDIVLHINASEEQDGNVTSSNNTGEFNNSTSVGSSQNSSQELSQTEPTNRYYEGLDWWLKYSGGSDIPEVSFSICRRDSANLTKSVILFLYGLIKSVPIKSTIRVEIGCSCIFIAIMVTINRPYLI